MIYTSIAFFALAAILGMILLSYVLRGKETPKGIVFTHGPLAATGLVLLIIYTVNKPGPVESIVLFTIAALGGVVMLVKDLSGKQIPKWLAVLHGLLAVSGFIFLLVFAFAKCSFLWTELQRRGQHRQTVQKLKNEPKKLK